jgi:hypothetical protein
MKMTAHQQMKTINTTHNPRRRAMRKDKFSNTTGDCKAGKSEAVEAAEVIAFPIVPSLKWNILEPEYEDGSMRLELRKGGESIVLGQLDLFHFLHKALPAFDAINTPHEERICKKLARQFGWA